ncbi:HD domain protein [Enterococcus faecalis 13-SD-W-01]|nr:HD domain protein [Enterococcus faecalis 13-SD-W-01]
MKSGLLVSIGFFVKGEMMKEQLAEIKNYGLSALASDQTGHGADHIQRVAAIAEEILKTEPEADSFIALSAAYLHDTIDDKVTADPQAAADQLATFLTELDVPQEKIQAIFAIIDNMSYSKELSGKMELSLEGKIVQDADRIDALGAIGILRTSYFGGGHGHPIHDPNMPPKTFKDKEDYRKGTTVINHFYEKLFLLSETMNTEYGKKEAKRREAFMKEFLDEFYREWGE